MECKIVIKSKIHGEYTVIVDESDYTFVSKYTWHINKCLNKMYASTRINNKIVRLHTLLIGDGIGHVDHVDGNSLNNTRVNLRMCTHAQNIQNIGKRISNKSGYKGVWYSPLEGKYKSQITVNRKKICIGTFENIKDAALAYNDAAKKHHGIFANLNNI